MREQGIQHRLSPPGHPATNGLAERYVQILKRKFKAMVEEQSSMESKFQQVLLRFRVTPLSNNKSPEEQFLGRQLKFSLNILKPPAEKKSNISKKPHVRSYKVEERVLSKSYCTSEQWKFGVIEEKVRNVTYNTRLDSGQIIKRHYNQLRPTSVRKTVSFDPKIVQSTYYPRQREIRLQSSIQSNREKQAKQ